MDWLRARLLLVATFTCLNIFLVYQLWARDFQSPHMVTLVRPAQPTEVRSRLAAMDITADGEIPTSAPSLSLLRVQPTTPAFATALLASFGGQALALPPPVHQELRDGSRTLILEPSGLITFRTTVQPRWARRTTLTSNVARRLAEDFLRSHGGVPADAQFVGVVRLDDDQLRVDYTQTWRQVPLLPPGLSITLSHGEVEEVQWLWLQPGQEKGGPKAVLPASEALLRLAGHLGDEEKRRSIAFRSVDLGYYATAPGGAKAWDTAPVWRITLDSGESFYINAFTGERER